MASSRAGSPGRSVSPSGHARAQSPSRGLSMITGHPMIMDTAKIKKNAKGGVLVTSEEIKAAFSMLDSEKTGQITLQGLKKRLSLFFPEMSAKEYRFLMNNRKELTVEDLEELLLENDVTNFDPVLDAFRAFDPLGTGSVSGDKLREVFSSCGFGELSDEELDILTRAADIDGDGVIGLEDFRNMVDLSKPLTHNHAQTAQPVGGQGKGAAGGAPSTAGGGKRRS